MGDLISRQGVIERVQKQMDRCTFSGIWGEHDKVAITCYKVVIEILKRFPSTDRPTGKWVDADGNKVRLDADGHPLDSCWCSNCGEWLVASDEYKVLGRFCPNCGAKNGGESDG